MLLACHSDEARDNGMNYMWDRLKQERVSRQDSRLIHNFYELLPQSENFRYGCNCFSNDVRGKQLTEVIPFTCAPDYCVRDIPNPPHHIGWTKDHCECGPYLHKDPLDPSSPCVVERTRIEVEGKLVGRVDCMTNFAWEKMPLYCPRDEGALSFINWIDYGSSPKEYLDRHKDSVEVLP